MNISRFFIDRPVFAGVLSVLIFVFGLIALGQCHADHVDLYDRMDKIPFDKLASFFHLNLS